MTPKYTDQQLSMILSEVADDNLGRPEKGAGRQSGCLEQAAWNSSEQCSSDDRRLRPSRYTAFDALIDGTRFYGGTPDLFLLWLESRGWA